MISLEDIIKSQMSRYVGFHTGDPAIAVYQWSEDAARGIITMVYEGLSGRVHGEHEFYGTFTALIMELDRS